jgi:hypothetical protein
MGSLESLMEAFARPLPYETASAESYMVKNLAVRFFFRARTCTPMRGRAAARACESRQRKPKAAVASTVQLCRGTAKLYGRTDGRAGRALLGWRRRCAASTATCKSWARNSPAETKESGRCVIRARALRRPEPRARRAAWARDDVPA